MEIMFRPVVPDEVPAYARTVSAGFGESPEGQMEKWGPWISLALDRTLAGFDGDAMVATGRNYSLELTVPGGQILRAGGVSAITVMPTHRRRGLLRQMMTIILQDSLDREEPVSMLTASEGSIYGRFGFGISTRSAGIRLDVRDVKFARPRPGGRLRLVELDDARKVQPDVFDRVRRAHPGAVSRPDEWWCQQFDAEGDTRFDVLYESEGGSVDGYVCYGIKERWGPTGAENAVTIRDFVAATDEATHALWRFLAEIDLVRSIKFLQQPIDSPFPWLLESPRGIRTEVHDFVWTRLLDVSATLGARTYPIAGRVVLEIDDPMLPDGAAAGTFAVEGGPDGAEVARTSDEPDLRCDVSVASAAWLGGVRWSDLARAGLVEERVDGALARADAMFASSPLPYPFTWF